MTVVVKSSKSIVEAKKDTQLHGKADHVLKTNEVNEFNMQSNKERKKVNCVTVEQGSTQVVSARPSVGEALGSIPRCVLKSFF